MEEAEKDHTANDTVNDTANDTVLYYRPIESDSDFLSTRLVAALHWRCHKTNVSQLFDMLASSKERKDLLEHP